MLTLFRWLLRLTVALIMLGVASAVLVWYFAIRSLPDYNATLSVEGVSAPVEIVRTTVNIPHIFGETDEDVFFALGLAHAQDRLFQMTVLRRAAQGRLSEIFGPTSLVSDDLARRLGFQRHALASYEVQDERTKAALEAYASGVNQWIEQVNLKALGRGAPEFFLFPDQITYWRPSDSIAILKLLAASSSDAAADEILRARLSLAWPEHGPEIVSRSGSGPVLQPYASLFTSARLGLPQNRRDEGSQPLALSGFLNQRITYGANAFAATSERTATGSALLANDPHIGLTAPSLFYLARLELKSGGVIGATIPGIPAVLSGRNAHLAWGLTPASIDDTDIYIEEVEPGNPARYRGASGWLDFTTRQEVIRVRDGADQIITLRETINGPVILTLDPGLPDVIPAGHVASVRWTGLSDQDRSISALIGLMSAQDHASARAAMADHVAPALTLTLASSEGVSQSLVGALPRRPDDHPTRGAMPVPGWLREGQWLDTLPSTQTPEPQTMVIATEEQPGGARRKRLDRLLQEREVHSRDSFIAAQIDTVSPVARSLLPLVGADLWFTGEPAPAGTPEHMRQEALRLLAEWDGQMNEHLPEPLIYSAWMAALQDRLIRDEIGPLADDITQLRPAFIEAVFRNRGGAARWCDIAQSAQIEDCTTIARQSLDQALLELSAKLGPDVSSWRWGDLHQARHQHPGLGHRRGLGWIMNLTQSVSGGDFTVARSSMMGRGRDPWQAVSGAGYRGVYDLADPDSSVFVISTGQSGHPLSRHYDDLAELWRRGEYVAMSLDPRLARAAAVGVTKLVPR